MTFDLNIWQNYFSAMHMKIGVLIRIKLRVGSRHGLGSSEPNSDPDLDLVPDAWRFFVISERFLGVY